MIDIKVAIHFNPKIFLYLYKISGGIKILSNENIYILAKKRVGKFLMNKKNDAQLKNKETHTLMYIQYILPRGAIFYPCKQFVL